MNVKVRNYQTWVVIVTAITFNYILGNCNCNSITFFRYVIVIGN